MGAGLSHWALLGSGLGAALVLGVLGWWRQRCRELSRYLSREGDWSWTPQDEPPDNEPAVSALRALGYRHEGILSGPPWSRPVRVLRDDRCATLALVEVDDGGATHVSLETFFSGGGRVTTADRLRPEAFTAVLPDEPLRLLEYRRGGAPEALDGQHRGTVLAWRDGGREPLEVSGIAVATVWREDCRRQQRAIRSAGLASLGPWIRVALGMSSRGTLRF